MSVLHEAAKAFHEAAAKVYRESDDLALKQMEELLCPRCHGIRGEWIWEQCGYRPCLDCNVLGAEPLNKDGNWWLDRHIMLFVALKGKKILMGRLRTVVRLAQVRAGRV